MAEDIPVSLTLRANRDGSFEAVFGGAEADVRRFKQEAEAAARTAAAAGAPMDAMGRAGAEAGRGAREAGAGMRDAATGATSAATAVRDTATAAQEAAAAGTAASAAAAALAGSYRATAQLGSVMTASVREVTLAQQAATGSVTGLGRAYEWMRAEAAAAQRAANETAAALGVSAASARAMAGAVGGSGQAAGATAGQFKLAGWQANQLALQLNDVATMAAMGASPFQILASQGGQVFQIFGSLGNMFGWFTRLLTPMVVGVGLVTAALGLGVGAWLSYESSIGEVERAMRTGGRAIEATADELEALARQTADTEKISVRSARSIQAAIVAAGGGSAEALEQAMAISRDWAAFTGQDMVDAATELGGAFRDLDGWLKKTEQTYGIYSAAQMRDIRNLSQQGDRAGAYARALSTINERAQNTADKGLGALGRAWAWVAQQASDAFDAMGKAIDGPTLEEQRDDARRRLQEAENRRSAASTIPGMDRFRGAFGLPTAKDNELENARAELARVEKAIADRDREAKEAAQRERRRQLGMDAQSAIDAADPIAGRRREIQNRITLINKAIAEGAVDAQEGAKAIALLRKEYADLRDPLEKVGKAYGDALKDLRATAAAQERLAIASAGGTAAIREAELANEAHAFAARAAAEGWASYQSAYDAAMAALQRGDLAATTQAFNEWTTEQDKAIAAATSMAEATAKGSAAVAEANIQARIAAEIERLRIEVGSERAKQVEQLIREEERLRQVAGYNTELQAAEDGLRIAQAELALAGQLPEVRDRIITRLREELRLKAQFPDLSEAERDALLKVLETTAEVEGQTKRIAEGRDLMLEPLKNAVRGIQDAFAGAFRSIFSGGVDSFKDLGDRILDIMIETAAQIAALLIFEPKVSGGAGLGSFFGLGSGPSAGGGTAGGGFSASSLTDVGKLFSLGGGSISPGLDAWAAGALGWGQMSTGGAAAAAGVAPVAGGLTNVAAAPGLLNGGSALAGFSSLSNVLGIAGAVLPGLISGNYAQAAAGGIGAAIGTILLPGIGTMLGGMFGNLVGGLFGKGDKDKVKILSGDSRQGNSLSGDTFDDNLALRSPYGYVGLANSGTSGYDAGFVSSLARALQRTDRATAQFLNADEIGTVTTSLLGQEGYSRSDREFDEEEFGKVIRGRLRPILEAVGINQQLIAATLAGTDAEELQQAAQELLARRAALRDIIEYSGEEGEIRKAQRQAVESLRDVLDELAAANEDFGFSAEGAAAASKKLVLEFLGLADVVEPMSDVEKAIASLNERFEQAATLAAAVGIETPIEELRAQAMAKLRDGFDEGIQAQIRAMVDPLGFALDEWEKATEQRVADAKKLGADLVEVERLNQLERNEVVKRYAGDLMGWLDAQLLGESSLSPGARMSAARGQFDTALGSGDVGNITGLADALLRESNSFYGRGTAQAGAMEAYVRREVEALLGGILGGGATRPAAAPVAGAFDTGGSFTVGGSGGADSTFVPLHLTPGEIVNVNRQDNARAVADEIQGLRRQVAELTQAVKDGVKVSQAGFKGTIRAAEEIADNTGGTSQAAYLARAKADA